jgi:hypothetical protein
VPARFAALCIPLGGALARENPKYAARIVGSRAVLPFGCISVRDETCCSWACASGHQNNDSPLRIAAVFHTTDSEPII